MPDKKEALSMKMENPKDYKKDDKGKYVYSGNIYRLNLTKKEINDTVKKYWLMTVLIFILELVGGFLPFKGMMECFYVIIPYCLELFMGMLLFWACFYFSTSREGMLERQYKRSVRRFLSDTLIYVVLTCISILASVIYVIINGFEGDLPYFLIYVLTKFGVGALNYCLHRSVASLDFRVSKN